MAEIGEIPPNIGQGFELHPVLKKLAELKLGQEDFGWVQVKRQDNHEPVDVRWLTDKGREKIQAVRELFPEEVSTRVTAENVASIEPGSFIKMSADLAVATMFQRFDRTLCFCDPEASAFRGKDVKALVVGTEMENGQKKFRLLLENWLSLGSSHNSFYVTRNAEKFFAPNTFPEGHNGMTVTRREKEMNAIGMEIDVSADNLIKNRIPGSWKGVVENIVRFIKR